MRIVPFGLCVVALALFFGSSPASASGCCYDSCYCKHHVPYWKHYGCGGGCGHYYPKYKPCHGCESYYPEKKYYGAHSYYPKYDGYGDHGYYPKKRYKAYSYYAEPGYGGYSKGGYGESYGDKSYYPKPHYGAYSYYPKRHRYGHGGDSYRQHGYYADEGEQDYDGGEGADYADQDEGYGR